MKKIMIFLMGMFFISFLMANEMDWRMYQDDNQRTGFTPYKGNFQHVMYEMWHREIGAEASLVLGNVDNDNEIEIVSLEGVVSLFRLIVINGKTGALEWVYNLPELSWQDGKSVPVIEDINNDGINEIILFSFSFSSLWLW